MARVLAPEMSLAVVSVAVQAPGAENTDSYWQTVLGKRRAEPDARSTAPKRGVSAPTGGLQDAGRVGLALCRGSAEALAKDAMGFPLAAFGATWFGGDGAADAVAALQWTRDAFAAGTIDYAVLGSVLPAGKGGQAENWLALMPLPAARAAGKPVLAIWSPATMAEAAGLVVSVGGTESEIAAALADAAPAATYGLPHRSLHVLSDGKDAGDAHGVLTACAIAVLAVAHRTLPPSRALGRWHGSRELGFGEFPRPRPWLFEPGRTLRTALVLAPSCGVALAVGDADPEGIDPLEQPWAAELIVLSAEDSIGLLSEIEALARRLGETAAIDLAALSRELWERPHRPHRCAIVASDGADLARKLATAGKRLTATARVATSPRERVFTGASPVAGMPVAFVIPGQGSQYPGMLRELAIDFPSVRRHFERLSVGLYGTQTPLLPLLHPAKDVVGTPAGKELDKFWREVAGGGMAGCMASQGLYELLRAFNVQPSVLVGHSIGESTALALAEALGPPPPGNMLALVRSLSQLTADLLRRGGIVDSAGTAVRCSDRAPLERALQAHAGRVFLALDNCPHQAVLLGDVQAIEAIAGDLRAAGASCLDMSLGAPFHTPLFAPAIESLSEFYDRLDVRAPRLPVWSCVANAEFPTESAALKALVLQQWTETVRFTDAILSLYERGVRIFIEVGPSDTLTGFIADILGGREHLALACDSQWFGGLEHLLATIGQLYVAGIDVGPVTRNTPLRTPSDEPAAPREAARSKVPGAGDAMTVLQSHATLLEEFRARHAQVLAAAPQRTANPTQPQSAVITPSTRPVPVRQSQSFPALGPRLDTGDGKVAFERRLTVESDPYLADHTFGKVAGPHGRTLLALPVVPFVMTLETLAEAALAATGRESGTAVVAGIERLRLHRWLTLDRGQVDVRVVAPVRNGTDPLPSSVRTELFEMSEAAPAGRWPVAEGTVVLAGGFAPPSPARQLTGAPVEARRSFEHFRRIFLFQGPSMRSFHKLVRMTDEGIEAEVVVPSRSRLFRDHPAPAFATGANLLDGAGQVIARWLIERWTGWYVFYPFSLERFEQHGPLPQPGERLKCLAFITDDGTTASADVEFQKLDGTVLYRYRDFKHRRFDLTSEVSACFRYYEIDCRFTRSFPTDTPGIHGCIFDGSHHDLVRPERGIFLQAIAHTVLGAGERRAWQAMPQGSPRRVRWLMGRIAAKEAVASWAGDSHGAALGLLDVQIEPDELGKPIVILDSSAPPIHAPEVSISHADTSAVAVIAESEEVSVGVDIEEERRGVPRTVPASAFAEGETDAANNAGLPPIALWCAKEAAAKALGVGLLGDPQRWRVHSIAADGRRALVSIDRFQVPVTLVRYERGMIAIGHVSRSVAAAARSTLVAAGAEKPRPS